MVKDQIREVVTYTGDRVQIEKKPKKVARRKKEDIGGASMARVQVAADVLHQKARRLRVLSRDKPTWLEIL